MAAVANLNRADAPCCSAAEISGVFGSARVLTRGSWLGKKSQRLGVCVFVDGDARGFRGFLAGVSLTYRECPLVRPASGPRAPVLRVRAISSVGRNDEAGWRDATFIHEGRQGRSRDLRCAASADKNRWRALFTGWRPDDPTEEEHAVARRDETDNADDADADIDPGQGTDELEADTSYFPKAASKSDPTEDSYFPKSRVTSDPPEDSYFPKPRPRSTPPPDSYFPKPRVDSRVEPPPPDSYFPRPQPRPPPPPPPADSYFPKRADPPPPAPNPFAPKRSVPERSLADQSLDPLLARRLRPKAEQSMRPSAPLSRTVRRKEEDPAKTIEMQILEFMNTVGNPNSFPTEQELLDAGRSDLAEAIRKSASWMAVGWDNVDSSKLYPANRSSAALRAGQERLPPKPAPAPSAPPSPPPQGASDRNGPVGGVPTFSSVVPADAFEREIVNFIIASGRLTELPSETALLRAGRNDLVAEIKERGGWLAVGWRVAELMGYKRSDDKMLFSRKDVSSLGRPTTFNPSATASPSFPNVQFRSATSVQGVPQRTPSGEIVRTPRLGGGGGAVPGITNFGGVTTDSSGRRSTVGLDNLERQLREFMDKYGYGDAMPTEAHLMVAGKEELAAAVKRYGGFLTVASLFGMDDGTGGKKGTGKKGPGWLPEAVQRKGAELLKASLDSFQQGRLWKRKASADKEKEAVMELGPAGRAIGKQLGLEGKSSGLVGRLLDLEASLLSVRGILKKDEGQLKEVSEMKGWKDLESVEDALQRELLQASDQLEWRESDIIRTSKDLRTVQSEFSREKGRLNMQVNEITAKINERERRLKSAEMALQRLKLVRVTWSGPANHVLLVGSFDSWTRQIEMKREKTGMFETELHLYPGRYEMKFIVDGQWRVDPYKMVSSASGNENNVLYVE
eukprot:jgi/Mesvir1/20946/Mv08017-RA.1